MDRSDICYLVSETQTQTDTGTWTNAGKTERKIYCRVLSFDRLDWHEAGRDGLNPGYKFVIFAPEYKGEENVKYKNNYYYIYRTHEGKNPDELELYTSKRQGKRGGE